MNTLLLLLTVASTLVLRSGDRIAVDGPLREEKGVVSFRSAGVLYSLPASEVLRVEKVEGVREVTADVPKAAPTPRRLQVSEEERKRLIEDLQRNHSGVAVPPERLLEALPKARPVEEVEAETREEWQWRREARAYEEALRRAKEELQLLEDRIRDLQAQIHAFVSLGFKPRQFTYQTAQLVRAQERLPYTRLEVERSQRAYDQFREDARRQGVLPGWLR